MGCCSATMNRPVRTRMQGGVGTGGANLPATRVCASSEPSPFHDLTEKKCKKRDPETEYSCYCANYCYPSRKSLLTTGGEILPTSYSHPCAGHILISMIRVRSAPYRYVPLLSQA